MDATISARPPRTRDAARIAALLGEARTRLIDTGTRNRLVHTNRKGKRPGTLAVLHPDTDQLFEFLVRQGATLPFRADPRVTARGEEKGEAGELPPLTLTLRSDTLQTRVGEEALQKRLLKLARDTKTLEEEQGVNILYLSLGFLRWYEDDKSEVLREAPLVLVPVKLVRDFRRSTFDLRLHEDEMSTNLPLLERLRDDFGILLPSIPENEEWTPSNYFGVVAEAVQSQRRWSIDRQGIELGLFSFAKLLMFKDLAGEAWPDESILEHPLLRGLLVTGFEEEPTLFPDATRIDERFQPTDLVQVIDADGSQTLAIETARAGRNLVIQGPPGTGKSQTIANIIASAVHDGKTVLFIAEKMVALEVVHNRLNQAGIGGACLELHSRAANKKLVAEELGRTLHSGAAHPNISADAERLKEVRDHLNRLTRRLHTPVANTGMTPYRALGHLVRAFGRGQRPPELRLPDLRSWDLPTYDRVKSLTKRLSELSAARRGGAHPWRGVRNFALQPLDLGRLRDSLLAIADRLDEVATLASLGAKMVGQNQAATLVETEDLLRLFEILTATPGATKEAVRHLAGLRDSDTELALEIAQQGKALQGELRASESVFVPAAFSAEPSAVKSSLARAASSWLARLGPRYRKASAELSTWLTHPLPKVAAERIALVDRLEQIISQRKALAARELEGALLFGAFWAGDRTDFSALASTAEWIAQIKSKGSAELVDSALRMSERGDVGKRYMEKLETDARTARHDLAFLEENLGLNWPEAFGSQPEAAPLKEIANRAREWVGETERYREWVELAGTDAGLRELGGGEIADRIADGRLAPASAVDELDYARAEAVWRTALATDPELARSGGDERSALVTEFKRLDVERRAAVAAMIRSRHSAAIPRGAMGEMAIIRGEAARRRGHMPIRKLMQRAGRTVQVIKPVFMMSPISVAQYLPAGTLHFDLIVIDEASQVRPEDALGVIARGSQVVVVGDRKQLPPTSFFSRLLTDHTEEEDDEEVTAAPVTELESILSLCEARGLPSKMLRWHYRSRHPSLIEVSNAEFYQSNLFLPPAPSTERGAEGLVIHRVGGAYDRGGKRTNVIEAREIVDAVVKHATEAPELTLGIVTFSTAQRDLVSDLLDERRRSDPLLDAFLRPGQEEVFVKNLENVQGDERDVILISIGYGPRQPGARLDSMNFGPVSSEGGERRLNVLFTRARHRCQVFSSFDSGDIDLGRATGQGPRALKRFLGYAETGALDLPDAAPADYDSPFEEDVAHVIRSLGYLADPQVGSVGFRLDLGVRHPEDMGRYILAVECDGAAYHGALWARERDRLRQEILEGLGWHFHRIWSTDWFYRRQSEIDRLKRALAQARSPRPRPTQPPPAPPAIQVSTSVVETAWEAKPYEVTRFAVPSAEEPHEIPTPKLAEVVEQIVATEGPIHAEEVGRRVAALFGKERAGARIAKATVNALRFLSRKKPSFCEADGFWSTQEQRDQCPIRNRSAAPVTIQRADIIPPLEIEAAIRRVLRENGGMQRAEIAVAVARLLGFQRTGQELRTRIDGQLSIMITEGGIEAKEHILRLS